LVNSYTPRAVNNVLAILTDIYGSIIAVNNTRSAEAITKILTILAFTKFLMNLVRDIFYIITTMQKAEKGCIIPFHLNIHQDEALV
jgi:hypothetical protein